MTQAILLVVLPFLFAYAAASDLFTMTIPNRISLALLASFAIFAPAAGLPAQAVALHVGAGLMVLAVCFAFFAFGWMGGGDAKLAAAAGLWFGFGALLDFVLLASLAGTALTLGLVIMRAVPLPPFALGWNWLARLHDRKTGIPYGIALAAAALLVLPQSPVWTRAFGA